MTRASESKNAAARENDEAGPAQVGADRATQVSGAPTGSDTGRAGSGPGDPGFTDPGTGGPGFSGPGPGDPGFTDPGPGVPGSPTPASASSPRPGPRPGPDAGRADPDAGRADGSRAGLPDAGTPAPASAPGPPPGARPPLPGPPPSARPPLPGPPGPRATGRQPWTGGPGFAPTATPRSRLTAAQRSRLLRIVLALIAVSVVLGWLVALATPTQYLARTSVEYTIAGENTGEFLKTDRDLTTQVVLLTSRNVLQPVADANGVSVTDLGKRVSASIVDESNVIQLEVRDRSRQRGVDLANAITRRYLELVDASGPRGYLQAQLDDVRAQQGTPSSDAVALGTRAAALQSKLDELNLTANKSSVIVPAYSVEDARYPDPAVSAITGAVCGLVVALLTAVTLVRRWTRS